VGQSTLLQERFYAVTTPHRHRIELVERLLTGAPAPPVDAAALSRLPLVSAHQIQL
jgi:LysR family transcriptional activator of nhaA